MKHAVTFSHCFDINFIKISQLIVIYCNRLQCMFCLFTLISKLMFQGLVNSFKNLKDVGWLQVKGM